MSPPGGVAVHLNVSCARRH